MEKIQNSPVREVSFGKTQGQAASEPIYDNRKSNVKDGDKKSMDMLKWAGIIAAGALAVGGTVWAVKTGKFKKPVKLDITGAGENKVMKVGDKTLTFKDGTAMLDGKKAEGTLKFVHNGATVTYKDGVLAKSVKKDNWTKTYKNGLISKAKHYTSDGTIKTSFERNEKNQITKMKAGDQETILNYDKNGNFLEATRDGKKLTSKANAARTTLPQQDELMEAMDAKSLRMAALEEKMADGQVSNLNEANEQGLGKEWEQLHKNTSGATQTVTPKTTPEPSLDAIREKYHVPKGQEIKNASSKTQKRILKEAIEQGIVKSEEDAVKLGFSQRIIGVVLDGITHP